MGDPNNCIGGICMVPDITGFNGDHSRIRLICDQFADYGFLFVLLLSYMCAVSLGE